jgi:hypothetical protein
MTGRVAEADYAVKDVAGFVRHADSPDEMIARLVTDAPTPYVLRGHTLAEVQAPLPPGLDRTERQPSDPPEVVEIWFPG